MRCPSFFLGEIMGRIIGVNDQSGRIDLSIYNELSPEISKILFLSERTAYIIRAFVFPFLEWKTNWGRWISNKSFDVGEKDDEAVEQLKEFLMEDYMTSIMTELADAIRYLADKPCCPSGGSTTVNCIPAGSVGTGSSLTMLPVGSEITQEELDAVYSGEVVPEGFSTQEEWEDAKCRGAHAVAIAVRAFFALLAGQAWQGTAVAFGWFVLSTLVVSIPTMILSGLLTLITSLEGYVLQAVADYIGDNYDRIVCKLNKSQSLADAIEGFLDIMDELISDAVWSVPVKAKVREVLVAIASETIAQKMFTIAATFLPEETCSCDATLQLKVQSQTTGLWVVEGTYPTMGEIWEHTIASQQSGSYHYVAFRTFLKDTDTGAVSDFALVSIGGGFGNSYGSCMYPSGLTNNVRSILGVKQSGVYQGAGITGNVAFSVVVRFYG
jgi:hypothetical protein